MEKIILWLILGVLVLFGLSAFLLVLFNAETAVGPIGGERDDHGCLVPAGYSWNETEMECVRGWLKQNDSERYQVTNFQQCIDSGYPVMESMPRQCSTLGGRKFAGN